MYDPESDCAFLHLGNKKKVYESVEFNENIVLDLLPDGKIESIELLDASVFLSDLLHRKISREEMKKHLAITLGHNNEREISLNVSLDNERVVYAIPKAYSSPVLNMVKKTEEGA